MKKLICLAVFSLTSISSYSELTLNRSHCKADSVVFNHINDRIINATTIQQREPPQALRQDTIRSSSNSTTISMPSTEKDINGVTAFFINPSYYNAEYHVKRLLEQQCPSVTFSFGRIDRNIYLPQGRCFSYDASGNYTASEDCEITEPNNPWIFIEDPIRVEDSLKVVTLHSNELLENWNSKIQVYPNPTADIAYIRWDADLFGKINFIEAVNPKGTNVSNFEIKPDQREVVFDLRNHPAGMYRLKITFHTGQFLSKTLIKL